MPISLNYPSAAQERPMKVAGLAPFLIGICGGSGSGKTLIARSVVDTLGPDSVLLIEQDSYYRDIGDLPLDERALRNFDHPGAFDSDLMIQNMRDLLAGKTINLPVYDYSQHARAGYKQVAPKNVILIDGILIFESAELRDLMDIRVFVDTEPDVRLARRLQRDIRERGRTVDSVLEQYAGQVRPMHDQFVEPSKQYADLIIPHGGKNTVAVDILITKVRALLRTH